MVWAKNIAARAHAADIGVAVFGYETVAGDAAAPGAVADMCHLNEVDRKCRRQ